jgi:hypothetical protein
MLLTLRRGITAALGATLLSAIGHAAVLHVPGDYSRIQNAIDAATNGDLIFVSPGVYNENINFKGKAISVTSTSAADLNIVKSTVIHASGQSSVVSFVSGETSNSVLAGFTITGGYGTATPVLGAGVYCGAGIYCLGSSPTIFGNIIISNSAPNGSGSIVGYGGGIACIQSDALISRNLIIANTAYAGGGVGEYLGKARFASNLICSNSAAAFGGGAALYGGQFINNTVVGNAAISAGTVYATSDAAGQSVVVGNIICGSTVGGGLYVDSMTQATCNDVWNNTDGNYSSGQDLSGRNGNISQDPQFVNATNGDFHLQDVSPCINAGDRTFQPWAGERDYYGNARVCAGRVDIGADEYFDNFRPVPEAGPDQLLPVTVLPVLVTLDGRVSSDPNGATLSYYWSQISGPAATLSDAGTARPSFNANALGTYVFQLVVSNDSLGSFPDIVQVTVTNAPPVADAGPGQVYSEGTASVNLDGSRSADPEQMPLSYRWTQISGWAVQLSDPHAVNPAFAHPWPGTYLFQLLVNDGLQDSQPAFVTVTVGSNHPPVASAGLSLYVSTNSVTLDGTGSYDPDGYGSLTYQWKQLSGPSVTMTGTNIVTPLVSGFKQSTAIQKCVFQLVVSNRSLASVPSTVTVTIVPNFGTNALYLENPPFDPSRPTIVAFGGGNCSTGSGLSFYGAGSWDTLANWITLQAYGTSYNTYGDMLMVYLSSVARNYQQPIQTIGFSTGNKPAMQAAWYVNSTYKDARYAVNRVSLCDAVCNNLSSTVASFQTNPVAGEQCWVDNYISNDPAHSIASYLPGALNVTCNPARDHSYPVSTYATSSLAYQNGGLVAFAYLSAIGSGKNYQLKTSASKYYFVLNSAGALAFFNQSLYPGKILAPVQLTGPTNGSTLASAGGVFGSQAVENAVRYQLLLGSDPNRVMDFNIITDTTNPPSQLITTLPATNTWWTVKAYDQFGSSIYADPLLIKRPPNRPPVAQAGADQVVYTGLDGTAAVTLNGSNSTDPEGDPLSYTWAWFVNGSNCLSNGMSVTIRLPVGVHSIQLMANDGQVNSQPAQLTVTVLPSPTVASVTETGGAIAFSWSAIAGRQYQVQCTTDLLSGVWQNVGGPFTATNTTLSASNIIGLDPQRFYRVALMP